MADGLVVTPENNDEARKCLLIFAPLVVVTGLLLWAAIKQIAPDIAADLKLE